MKVDQRALDAIERKISRAGHHLLFLYEEMAEWDAEKPWRFVQEIHDEGRKQFFRLHLLKPIPVDWAVVLGEALHDLRSALDQVVYWLTVDWTGRSLENTAFPVYRSKADFYQRHRKTGDWAYTSGMHKIRGVGPGPRAFIEALQPYPQRRREQCFELWSLHSLWNQDKHRLVHLWGLRFSEEKLKIDAASAAAGCVLGIDRRVLHHNAIVLKATSPNPHGKVKVSGEANASIAFMLTKRKGGGQRSLWDLATAVGDVVRKLSAAIGNQRAELNLDWWTATVRP